MKGFRVAGICLGALLGIFLARGAVAQWNAPNPVVSFEKKGNAL